MELISKIDSVAFDFLESISCGILDNFFKIITFTGNGGVIWIGLILGLFVHKRNRKIGVAVMLSFLSVVILNNLVLKEIFDRTRPFVADPNIKLLIDIPSGSSFPSGHSSSSFACAVALFMFDKKWGMFAFGYATLMAISRVYLHVHYATDVIGGMIVGVLVGFVVVAAWSRVEGLVMRKLGLEDIQEQ